MLVNIAKKHLIPILSEKIEKMKEQLEEKMKRIESSIYDLDDELDGFHDYSVELSEIKSKKNKLQ